MNPASINPLELPSVPLSMRAQLPEKPVIYFAIDSEGTTQYIGKSINPKQRWIHHHHYISLSRMGDIRIAWLEVALPEKLPELEKALIESFQPPLNRVFNPTYLITNPIAYRLELPKKLRTQFKGMTAMNGTNMKDALIHFIEWYVGKRPNLPQNKILKQSTEWTKQD